MSDAWDADRRDGGAHRDGLRALASPQWAGLGEAVHDRSVVQELEHSAFAPAHRAAAEEAPAFRELRPWAGSVSRPDPAEAELPAERQAVRLVVWVAAVDPQEAQGRMESRLTAVDLRVAGGQPDESQ